MNSAADVLEGRVSWAIVHSHVLDGLRALPEGSVHCVVTSPPYWGLRAYGTDVQTWGEADCEHDWETVVKPAANGIVASAMQGETLSGNSATRAPGVSGMCRSCGAWRGELGSEPTIGLYIEHMVEIFREIRRVLRTDGTCWLNMGDSYAGSGRGPQGQGVGKQSYWSREGAREGLPMRGYLPGETLKPKDLCLIPWRLTIALQDDGWWIRSVIPWCKRAPMPESVTDRPTSAWEPVFLLTKSSRYFYDQQAVREPVKWPEDNTVEDHDRAFSRRRASTPEQRQGALDRGYKKPAGWQEGPGAHDAVPMGRYRSGNLERKTGSDLDDSFVNGHLGRGFPGEASAHGGTRNLWNYWILGPEPFPDAHFATFPTEIPRKAILAGTSERGVCSACGASWRRVTTPTDETLVARRRQRDAERARGPVDEMAVGKAFTDGIPTPNVRGEVLTVGWEPSCKCAAGAPVPAVVLDPFSGSGTTAMVALRLNRRAIGLELNAEYVSLSRRRVSEDAPLFNGIVS